MIIHREDKSKSYAKVTSTKRMFAWLPVKITNGGQLVWLEWVYYDPHTRAMLTKHQMIRLAILSGKVSVDETRGLQFNFTDAKGNPC